MTPSTHNTEGQRGCECDWSGYLCLNCIQGKPCACDGCRHSAPAEPMVSLKLGVAMRLLGMVHERDYGDEQARIELEAEISRAATEGK